jgi:hypothetical protein
MTTARIRHDPQSTIVLQTVLLVMIMLTLLVPPHATRGCLTHIHARTPCRFVDIEPVTGATLQGSRRVASCSHCFESGYLMMHWPDCHNTERSLVLQTVLDMYLFSSPRATHALGG